ncbi:hypothetical protein [Methylophilus sp. 14]|uniref:hypothetical protein n=1 Tax=Methylophilus sp. 14 TaxID=2781019 RepID=UPI00188F16AF|nr:hypothetical protein [Methylophilus sp. 14]MBF4988801.1 hypothetical protein [Methylophilus sp. 14]
MDQKTRISKIQEIIDRDEKNPFGVQEIAWEDSLKSMNVYKIPLAYLVYNKYNGRILSRTKSLEKQNHSIDVETPEGKKQIERLLWDSKEDRNKTTQADLAISGQKKVGIITRDGIIIDGNRRAMLLNRLGKDDYFKAVVLPVTLEENPIEIKKLETSFQMGEDEKLGYNPIEKYLKAKDLYTDLSASFEEEITIAKIADWMGEQKSAIKDYLAVMDIMDEYLSELGYDGIYTQLDGREDQFISLTKWMENFYGETSSKAFDGYKDNDVDDLKIISFDYIRDKYEGKEFRNLAYGLKTNHFFGTKEIWTSFRDSHFEATKGIEEPAIDFNSMNLKSHLDDRDQKFHDKIHDRIKDNLEVHYEKLRNLQSGKEPEKLIKRSIDSFDAIQKNNKAFKNPAIQQLVVELADKAFRSVTEHAPLEIFPKIISLLESIEVEKIGEGDVEKAEQFATDIQRLSYKLTKKLSQL